MSESKLRSLLLIEDDNDIRESLSDLLREEGYEVIAANNGLTALHFLRSTKKLPSLILLDVSMPAMNGHEFRREQMKDAVLSQIPTTLLSADRRLNAIAESSEDIGYLHKPIELNTLMALVEKHCGPPVVGFLEH